MQNRTFLAEGRCAVQQFQFARGSGLLEIDLSEMPIMRTGAVAEEALL